MNDKKIDIDQLFNSRLSKAEEAFDPNAWEKMQQKLNDNENRKGGFIYPDSYRDPNKSTKLKTIAIMTILIAGIAAISIYNYSPLQTANADQTNPSITNHNLTNNSQVANANPTTQATKQNTANYNAGINSSKTPTNKVQTANTAAMKLKISKASTTDPIIAKIHTKQSTEFINTLATLPSYKLTANTVNILDHEQNNPDSAKLANLVLGNKRYRYDKPWLGFHLTGMVPLGMKNDSGNYRYRPGIGINLELMTGDILKAKYIGVSVGGSMGFLWNGQSRKQNVTLATPNNDSGYTRLYNMNFHMDLIARAEFGNRRLKPFVDGVIGLRNMSTFQTVNSYETIQGYEETTNTQLSSWALQYGMSAGLRWHWIPGVSVDLRGTLYSGTNINFIDVKRTPFNGSTASYNPVINTTPSNMFVLRLGLLFDLDEMSYSQQKTKHNFNTSTSSYPQRYTKSTPVYDNKNDGNNGGKTSGSSGGQVGGSKGSGSKGGTPLKIKVPTAAPVRK
ncbi:MAG: hypothetical protein SGJ10_00820 [Bacteroidota bacterium]|nr:hypothetical protein [Bacteroidota bacterium]